MSNQNIHRPEIKQSGGPNPVLMGALAFLVALIGILYVNLWAEYRADPEIETLTRRIQYLEDSFDDTERGVQSIKATVEDIDRDFTLFESDIDGIDRDVAALAARPPLELPETENVNTFEEAVLIGVIVDIMEWCSAVAAPHLTGNIEGFQQCIINGSFNLCSVAFPDGGILFDNCLNPAGVIAGEIDPDIPPPIFAQPEPTEIIPNDTQSGA